jgi:hypothetical protein
LRGSDEIDTVATEGCVKFCISEQAVCSMTMDLETHGRIRYGPSTALDGGPVQLFSNDAAEQNNTAFKFMLYIMSACLTVRSPNCPWALGVVNSGQECQCVCSLAPARSTIVIFHLSGSACVSSLRK